MMHPAILARGNVYSFLACLLTLALAPSEAGAQLQFPMEIRLSAPVRDALGAVLPGSNPGAPAHGLPLVPGCLIQVINAGPDGKADWPTPGGNVSGDDTLLFTTSIGFGVVPSQTLSGLLDASFTPPPPLGTSLYARAFNASALAEATHWGQSAVFQLQSLKTVDLTAYGLIATTLPMSADPASSDSDGDGVPDANELSANTNASDPDDRPFLWLEVEPALPGAGLGGDALEPQTVQAADAGGVPVIQTQGRAGRRYILQRAEPRPGPLAWQDLHDTGVLTESRLIHFADEEAAPASRIYRVKILQP